MLFIVVGEAYVLASTRAILAGYRRASQHRFGFQEQRFGGLGAGSTCGYDFIARCISAVEGILPRSSRANAGGGEKLLQFGDSERGLIETGRSPLR